MAATARGAALAAVVGATCGAPGAPGAPAGPDASPSVGTPAASPASAAGADDSLVVTLTPGAARVPVGRPLRLEVRVRNAGTQRVTLEFSSACRTDYEVLSAAGDVVGTSMRMCAQMLTDRSLGAGEAFVDTLQWTPGARGTPPSAPGHYQLRGVLLRRGAPVRSPAVPIEVDAADGKS